MKSKKLKKAKKIKVVPIPRLMKKADKAFSQYVRDRDGKCVLDCDKCTTVIQCGHLIRRGKLSVRFDETNCNAQCSYHNFLHNSEPEHYYRWFIKNYGHLPLIDLVDRSKIKMKLPTSELRDYLYSIIKKYS